MVENHPASIHQSINPSIHQSINPSIHQSINPSAAAALRRLRRARLPQTYIGSGVSQAVLDGHPLNLRKERNARTQAEEWIDGVENHLGLAKTYARLAQTLAQTNRAPPSGAITSLEGIRFGAAPGVPHFQPGRVL